MDTAMRNLIQQLSGAGRAADTQETDCPVRPDRGY